MSKLKVGDRVRMRLQDVIADCVVREIPNGNNLYYVVVADGKRWMCLRSELRRLVKRKRPNPGWCEVSTPADRIRPVLQAISTAFPHKDTHDALAALAELERERDRHAEVREIITSVVCGALNRAGINEVDNPGVAIDAIRNRAENAERERDELRAKLAEYEQAPTIGVIRDVGSRPYCDWKVSQATLPKSGAEIIARPTRKDGE